MQPIIKRFCPLRSLSYASPPPFSRNISFEQLNLSSVRKFAQATTRQTNISGIRKFHKHFSTSVTKLSDSVLIEQLPLNAPSATLKGKLKGYYVIVELSDVGRMKFPAFWLRDNCQCSECIHPDTRQRMVDTFSIPRDVQALSAESDQRGLTIYWSDGHSSVYPNEWLKPHRYRGRLRTGKENRIKFRPFDIVHSDYKSLPTVSYEEVMTEEDAVLEWLEQIHRFGFCMVEGVPIDPTATQKLLERISFIRPTHYGGFWDFTADLTFKDTAYTSEGLGAHTDNTYFTDPARLQLFHMLSHTDGEGGASLLVDGFRAAKLLLKESPRRFFALKDHKQPFHASGNENVSIQPDNAVAVMQCREDTNELFQIRWNNYDRAAKVDWDFRTQEAWYDAARHWNNIIQSPELEIWTQLQPGTAMIFDNWRMLHGRSPFTGKRRMCGGYINNDDFMSRHRLLKFGRQNVLNHLGVPRRPVRYVS